MFKRFPDSLETLRQEELAYFTYKPTTGASKAAQSSSDLECPIRSGVVKAEPITYEDFLPVSAAGIFHSNLGGNGGMDQVAVAGRASFEQALGCRASKEFDLYSEMRRASMSECLKSLSVE